MPRANLVATTHHGILVDLHRPSFGQGSYVAFLGWVSPEERPDRAIRIAGAVGMPLKIAAKVGKVDEDYFRSEIRPLIDGPGLEFIGEINEREKTKFLGEAAALLFPVDRLEPFGLVMIEAMACGTPALAFRCGSIPEIIDDGVTSKEADSEKDAIAALPEIIFLQSPGSKKDLSAQKWPGTTSVLTANCRESARPTARSRACGRVNSISNAATA
jgi:glycosyltransferase involved in cell wall biosynthesis